MFFSLSEAAATKPLKLKAVTSGEGVVLPGGGFGSPEQDRGSREGRTSGLVLWVWASRVGASSLGLSALACKPRPQFTRDDETQALFGFTQGRDLKGSLLPAVDGHGAGTSRPLRWYKTV